MRRIFANVRASERRDVFGGVVTLIGVMTAHAMLEAARDALFLARIPASHLPFVYLGIAAISLLLTQVQRRAQHSSLRRALVGWLGLSGVVTLGFGVVVSLDTGTWVLYALYIWSGVMATLVLIHLWTLLGSLFTVTQAKRLFAVIGTGSVLGAIVGSGVAAACALVAPPQILVVFAAIIMGASALGPAFLLRDGDTGPRRTNQRSWSFMDNARAVLGRPYSRRMGLLVVSATVALTLADYIFKDTVKAEVAPESLGMFFASVYFVVNLLSLGVQLFLVSWVLRRFSIDRVLSVLPIVLGVAAAGVAGGFGVGAALLLKGGDGSLRYSLHRTASELLFVPLSERHRARIKAFIDVVGQRGGQALASVGILALVGFGLERWALAVVLMALTVLWLILAIRLREPYLDLFRSTLREGLRATQVSVPDLDMASLETWIEGLSSAQDPTVIAAMELLHSEGKASLIPGLIVFHPSTEVVEQALRILADAERADWLPLADRVFDQTPSGRIRAAILRARSRLEPDEELFRRILSHDCPLTAGTALVGLINADLVSSEEGETRLAAILDRESTMHAWGLAEAIASQPLPMFVPTLLRLLEEEKPEIVLTAVRGLGASGDLRALPKLIELLGQRVFRGAAEDAIVAIGDSSFDALGAALRNPEYNRSARRRLPLVIAQMSPEPAAALLLAQLEDPPRDSVLRDRIVRALTRMRRRSPNLELDGGVLRGAVERTLTRSFQLLTWVRSLERGVIEDESRGTEVHELLRHLLQDKESKATRASLRLISLLYPQEDMRRVARGLHSKSPKVRSSSQELLEHVVPNPLRDAILGLIDTESPLEQRLAYAGPFRTESIQAYDNTLRVLLQSDSDSLRSLALYHIGELGLTTMAEHVEAMGEAQGTGLFDGVLERVISLLRRPAGQLAVET